MKNVTLTLKDGVVARVRVAAAQQDKSVSRFVSDLVEQRVGRATTQQDAVDAFLAGPSLPLTRDGRAPTTDEMHD